MSGAAFCPVLYFVRCDGRLAWLLIQLDSTAVISCHHSFILYLWPYCVFTSV